MTLSTVASNHILSELLNMYNDGTYTPEKNKQYVSDWSSALAKLTESMTSFVSDAARLEAYISGQR